MWPDEYGLVDKEDFNDLDEDGRNRGLSTSVSTVILLDSPPAFLIAGIAMVGTVRSGCFGLRLNSSAEVGLNFGTGLPRTSLAPVDPCLGLRPTTERLPSSENSDESSYPLIIPSQGLQTRKDPDWPKCEPGRSEVHFASKIWPHVLQ